MKKRSWLPALLAACGGYLLLLAALILAERGDPDASIRSFSDAVWYSIVTISTVGYGDLYPVTPAGKVIGLVFLVLSVGTLAFLVGSAVSLLTGKLLPKLQLRALKNKKWYVFSELNESSAALAASIAAGDPEALLLFPAGEKGKAPAMQNCRFYPESIAAAVEGKRENCVIFFLSEDGNANYANALAALPLGHSVYCRTYQTPDSCPEGLHLFDRYSCCAQDYWHGHPLTAGEQTVVIIGDGCFARELLLRGLMMNVFDGERGVQYHVFGDWSDFRRCHPQLGVTVCVDAVGAGDSLIFHRDAWNDDAALLANARIILCDDDRERNMTCLSQLRRWYPLSGKIHLRSDTAIPGEDTFGTVERIFTAEIVIGDCLTATARAMHRIYTEANGGKDWEELSEFTRQSNLAAADHLLVKIRLLLDDDTITRATGENCRAAYRRYLETRQENRDRYRSLEHLRWMRFHSLYNWRYGPVRDNAARIHPMLVPFDQLPESEQAKDDYAWVLLGSLSRVLK